MPYEWIAQAVAYTGKASIRQRRLPAEQAVWLVIALVLYRHQSISEVVDDLDLALPDMQAPFVSKSAVAQARQRLGVEPLKALFALSARAWSEQDSKPLRLLDGLLDFFRCQCSCNNAHLLPPLLGFL